jgi:hypothetical protein
MVWPRIAVSSRHCPGGVSFLSFVEPSTLALIALVSGLIGAGWGMRKRGGSSSATDVATPPTDPAQTMEQAVRRALSLASRHQRPVSVVAVLTDPGLSLPPGTAAALQGFMVSRVRVHDVVLQTAPGRWTLLLPDTDAGGALIVAEDLRTGATRLKTGSLATPLTLSLGIHGRLGTAEPEAPAEMLQKCHTAAEAAWSQGGDRVEIEP